MICKCVTCSRSGRHEIRERLDCRWLQDVGEPCEILWRHSCLGMDR